MLLSAVPHVIVGFKRTWDINLGLSLGQELMQRKLDFAISGLTSSNCMTIYLGQFRFGATQSRL